jgi:hypothetical protein
MRREQHGKQNARRNLCVCRGAEMCACPTNAQCPNSKYWQQKWSETGDSWPGCVYGDTGVCKCPETRDEDGVAVWRCPCQRKMLRAASEREKREEIRRNNSGLIIMGSTNIAARGAPQAKTQVDSKHDEEIDRAKKANMGSEWEYRLKIEAEIARRWKEQAEREDEKSTERTFVRDGWEPENAGVDGDVWVKVNKRGVDEEGDPELMEGHEWRPKETRVQGCVREQENDDVETEHGAWRRAREAAGNLMTEARMLAKVNEKREQEKKVDTGTTVAAAPTRREEVEHRREKQNKTDKTRKKRAAREEKQRAAAMQRAEEEKQRVEERFQRVVELQRAEEKRLRAEQQKQHAAAAELERVEEENEQHAAEVAAQEPEADHAEAVALKLGAEDAGKSNELAVGALSDEQASVPATGAPSNEQARVPATGAPSEEQARESRVSLEGKHNEQSAEQRAAQPADEDAEQRAAQRAEEDAEQRAAQPAEEEAEQVAETTEEHAEETQAEQRVSDGQRAEETRAAQPAEELHELGAQVKAMTAIIAQLMAQAAAQQIRTNEVAGQLGIVTAWCADLQWSLKQERAAAASGERKSRGAGQQPKANAVNKAGGAQSKKPWKTPMAGDHSVQAGKHSVHGSGMMPPGKSSAHNRGAPRAQAGTHAQETAWRKVASKGSSQGGDAVGCDDKSAGDQKKDAVRMKEDVQTKDEKAVRPSDGREAAASGDDDPGGGKVAKDESSNGAEEEKPVAGEHGAWQARGAGRSARWRERCGRKYPGPRRDAGDHATYAARERAWLDRERAKGRNALEAEAHWAKGRQAWMQNQQWQHRRRARKCKAERGREKPRRTQTTCTTRAVKEEQLDREVAPLAQEECVKTEQLQVASVAGSAAWRSFCGLDSYLPAGRLCRARGL